MDKASVQHAHRVWVTAAVVAFYFVTSLSLVLLNKFMFSSKTIDFDAPIFLTWTQIVVAVGCCLLVSSLNKTVSAFSFFPDFEYDLKVAKQVFPLTLMFIGMIVCNNLCLKYVEVTFYQVARALTIVFNIVFSYTVLGQSTSSNALLCCVVIVTGYVLGCDGEINFSVAGVIFGVLSSAFVCLYSIYTKKLLPVLDNNEWKLLIYNNVNSMLVIPVVFFLIGEGNEVFSSPSMYIPHFWAITFVTGLFGFLINISTFLQIKYTSALTHNVSGTAKAGVQTIIGAMIWRNPISIKGGVGNALSILGCFLYGLVRYQEMQNKAPTAPIALQPVKKLSDAEEGQK